MQHKCIGKVVDVLTGAREVKIFFLACQGSIFLKLLLQEVLDSFDIVVGCSFNLFDALSVSQ